MSTTTKTNTCEGCNAPLSLMDQAQGYDVCMGCTRARHASVMASGACRCGRKKRPLGPVEVGGIIINGVRRGARTINRCARCLGNVR